MNFLLIQALQKFHHFYGDSLKVACPTGSDQLMTLSEVATGISRRLTRIFLRGADGRRPVYGGTEKFQQDPHWRDLILFYEYFHGDNGAGLGASHQTGPAWWQRCFNRADGNQEPFPMAWRLMEPHGVSAKLARLGGTGQAGRNTWACLGVTLMGLGLLVWHVPRREGRVAKGPTGESSNRNDQELRIRPSTVTVTAGTTIRWINADVANHQILTGTVEGDRPKPDGRISSPLLFRGDEFTATFNTPGTYPYYCGLHPFMRGTIVVK